MVMKESNFLKISWNDEDVKEINVETNVEQQAWQSFRALCTATAYMANRFRTETGTKSLRSFEHVQELLKLIIEDIISKETNRCIFGNESPEGAGQPVHQLNATQAEKEARRDENGN